MFPEQVETCESVWAEMAFVGPLARVAHHVTLEDAVAAKATLADGAPVGPVTTVRPFMTQQIGTANKVALADATLVGPLSCVPASMICKVKTEVEALGAQITFMMAHACVPQQVFHKCLLVRECLVTDFTLVGLANPVDQLVSPQLVNARERAAALLALQWPLGSSTVHLDMHCQPLSCREHSLAARARVLFHTGARGLLLHEQTSRECCR